MDGRQTMNMSRQKTHLNFEAHGINCLDRRCVLPWCVNVKLSRQASPPQKKKQIRQTKEDPSRNGVSRQGSDERRESLPQNQSVLVHDADHELLKELKHFESILKGKGYEAESTFLEELGITQQPNVNRVWKVLESQQVPQAADHDPALDMRMNAASWFPPNADHTYEKSSAFKVFPKKSVSDSTEDLLCLSNDLEQFIPIERYLDAPGKGDGSVAKRTKHDPQEMTNESPAASNSLKATSSQEENHCKAAAEIRGVQSQPKDTNIFGVLSEILRIFESPMSADREASCVLILQRALKEIQSAVPF